MSQKNFLKRTAQIAAIGYMGGSTIGCANNTDIPKTINLTPLNEDIFDGHK